MHPQPNSQAHRPNRDRSTLVQADIHALRGLLALTKKPGERDARYHAKLAKLETALSPAAASAWREWTSDALQAELMRWKPLYKVERTQQGYRTLPYLHTVKRYRKTPEQTRLTWSQAEPFSKALIRV